LRKEGIHTIKTAPDRFLARHKITRRKKSLLAAARARRKWIREQGFLDPAKLAFIDETRVNTSMVRLCGRAPCGVRLVDHVPLGQWNDFRIGPALETAGKVLTSLSKVARVAGPVGIAIAAAPDAISAVHSFSQGHIASGFKSLAKGAICTGTTVAGAAVGQALIPIPGVGAAGGAVVGGAIGDAICSLF
jgi:hypothetical protein